VSEGDATSRAELRAELEALRARVAELEGASPALDSRAQRAIEQALRASEHGYRVLVEWLPYGLAVAQGTALRLVLVNRALAEILGRGQAELLAYSPQQVEEIIHRDDRDRFLHYYRQRLAGHPAPTRYECRAVRPDGVVRWLVIDSERLEYQGQPAVRAVITDVTEHKAAEAALRDSEERCRTIVESIADGVVLMSAGQIEYVSPTACRMFGRAADELVGRPPVEVVVPEQRAVAREWVRTAQRGVAPAPTVFVILRPDGTRAVLEASASVIRRRDEPVLVVVARDVAERLRADQEKAELQAQLTHAQKMQAAGQVAAGIAHDFGNLLAVIRNGVNRLHALLPADSAGGWTETLDVVERAAQEASSSTRSLLMFTRRVPAERVPLNLCQLTRDSAQIMRHLLPPTIELHVRTCRGAGCWISGDPGQLQQVLLNLVLNARDAMSAGGRLEITVTSSPNGSAAADSGSAPPAEPTVRLSVRDGGVGIPQHLHARIFEPFFTTKAGGYGTGLGLATVQSIIADHGGHLELESEVGRGSTFTVVLPQTLPAAAQAEGVRGRGETILLMEPNRHIQRLVMSTLRSWGYAVLTAPDGASAYEAYDRSPDAVALLILNADVPEQGALECVQRVRSADRQVPIVLTVGSLSTDVSCLLADEATVLLHKPFQMAELGRVLSRLLTQRADGAE